MLTSLRRLLTGLAVLSLVALSAVLVIYGLVKVVPDAIRFRRAEFPPELSLGKTVCSGWSTGLTEGSWIAVYRLDPASLKRVGRAGLALLNENAPPTDRKWLWTPWMTVGSGADVLGPEDRGFAEGMGSRARMFVVWADRFAYSKCEETIGGLDWEGALVRFKYPRSWSVEMCLDSCLAQVLLPASGLATGATFD